MQKISFFILLSFFLSFTVNAADNTVVPKVKQEPQVKPVQAAPVNAAGGRLAEVIGDKPDITAVKPENTDGALCRPNDTQSCSTSTVSQGDEDCKQDTCVCVNSDGNSTYNSTGTTYQCVPKVDLIEPVETETPGG